MSHDVCHWCLGYVLVNPLRRLFQNPDAIVAPHVREGMTVLEPGPGMGFFTLPMARRVGPRGRVIAVDVQPQMLDGLRRRAARAGLAGRIETRRVESGGMGLGDLSGQVDLAFAFYMVHEVPDPARFLAEVAAALRPGGRLLVVEPPGHVSAAEFERTLGLAAAAGLRACGPVEVGRNRAALLERPAAA